jgi:hypothetical protein
MDGCIKNGLFIEINGILFATGTGIIYKNYE